MTDDPIVEEIHRIRQEIAAEFNYDLHALAEEFRRRERENKDNRVYRSPVDDDNLATTAPSPATPN